MTFTDACVLVKTSMFVQLVMDNFVIARRSSGTPLTAPSVAAWNALTWRIPRTRTNQWFLAPGRIFSEGHPPGAYAGSSTTAQRNISVKVPMSILLSGLLRCSTRQFLYWGSFLETAPLQRKG